MTPMSFARTRGAPARHPATAARIAHKLAVRLVSDDPPSTLVDRLAQAYVDNGTAIAPVLRVLFGPSEFWTAIGTKTRRPLVDPVATTRFPDHWEYRHGHSDAGRRTPLPA